MTEKTIDTRGSARNVAVKEKLLNTLDGALVSAMQEGFWGTVRVEIPFENGAAQRGMVRVEQHTPILA